MTITQPGNDLKPPRQGEHHNETEQGVTRRLMHRFAGNMPDVNRICTSHIEKQNHTLRMHCRRLTRLTNAFSKKFENFQAAVALNFCYYNFVKTHGAIRMTPAQCERPQNEGKNMTPDKDELEFIYFLKELAKSGQLEGAALGIAKQTITKGQASLSDKQAEILNAVVEKIKVKQCPKCHQDIPWSEMFYAIEKGTCAACRP
jgi:hypothetical protein